MFSTIVHPTDLSEASLPALKSAHDLAKALKSKLLVCYIAHPPLVASGAELTDPKTDETRNVTQEVQMQQPFDPAVRGEVRVIMTERSTGVKTLLAFLEKMGCDLLVLGMHKRSGLYGWLGPSITEEVVRAASCAVMVVK